MRYKTMIAAAALFCATAVGANLPVQMNRHGNQIEVRVGGKPFTTYYFDPSVAKPYLQPLRSAEGTIVTRGFPVENTVPEAHWHDRGLEPHQRPLYFAHGDIDGLDFWGEEVFNKFYGSHKQAYGRMVFRKLDTVEGGPDSGTIRAEFDLVTPNNRRIASEIQSFTFGGDAESRTIDCEFAIEANYGPVDFGDSKEGTFAIRVAPELNSPPGHMVDSNRATGEKGIWGTRSDWVDYYGTVSGEPVGIAIFDSPRSFRHPTYWHARGYGLFAANPFGVSYFTRDPKQNGSWSVREGQSIVFRYRVLIHHGDYRQAHVREAYERYAREEK
ncbi:MAG: PmoA family protein [Terriglobia bacterium]